MSKNTDRINKAKKKIITRLKRRMIARVTIEYDGEGDEGCIQETIALNATREPVKIPDDLQTELEDFTWDVLGHWHDGFQDNTGGFGHIVINVTKGKATIQHSQRVIETSETCTEV